MAAKIETSAVAASDLVDWERKTHLQKGATGFLGRKLVDSLAASNEVEAIHIFSNINPVTDDEKRQTAKWPTRGSITVGSVREIFWRHVRLGLSDLASSSTMDITIHVAVGLLVDAYAPLRDANLEPVRTLRKLAADRRISFHFISGESGEAVDRSKEILNTARFDNYMASQDASKSYLSQAESTLGFPSRCIDRDRAPISRAAAQE
jgi:thioester reductase-like protein